MSRLHFILLFGILVFISVKVGFVASISVQKFLTLTKSEKNALDQFRARVEPLLKEHHTKQDIFLIRWLRAQNFDVDAAEKMLRNSLKWRKENKIDTIQKEDFSDIAADFHLTVDTYDKIGQPIGVLDMYSWDIRSAMLQGKRQRLTRFLWNFVENVTSQVIERSERGMNVTQMVFLINADGVNVVQQACPICLPFWAQFVQAMEAYYPHYLDEFIIIDAPQAANIVIQAVRPFFTKNTQNSFKTFGQNKKQWLTYLNAKIAIDQRTERYGGTKPT